jgi:hypothetical protein
MLGDWMSRKHREYWQSICGQSQAQGFYKRPSGRKAEELLNSSRNWLPRVMGVMNRTLSFKTMSILGLVNSPECCRRKQVLETASHVV